MSTKIRNFLRFIAAFIAVGVVLVLVFDKILMPIYVRHGKEVAMIDVLKLPADKAIQILDANGFEVQVVDTIESGNLPIGIVIDQQPPPGRMVKKGRVVQLVVTGGSRFVRMPNLVGRALKAAQIILENNKLVLDSVEYLYSSEIPEGVVSEQSILPGSMVSINTKVTVVVSKGPPSRKLEVPMLIGLSLTEARASIRKAGFRVGVIRYVPTTDLNPYTVIDQTPKPGGLYDNPINIDLQVTIEP